jgi:hypothetical protein
LRRSSHTGVIGAVPGRASLERVMSPNRADSISRANRSGDGADPGRRR